MEVGKFYRVIFKDDDTALVHVLSQANSYQVGECFIGESKFADLFYLFPNELEFYEVTKEKFERDSKIKEDAN